MAAAKKLKKGSERKRLSVASQTAVLTEAGYRCAVPTCRGILALQIHHIWEVHKGGGNDLTNLIALCPTCHALYHNDTITVESIYTWKAMLTAFSSAFDVATLDDLMFLNLGLGLELEASGILTFRRLIAAGFANVELKEIRLGHVGTDLYTVELTAKGRQVMTAWIDGRLDLVGSAFGPDTVMAATVGQDNNAVNEKRKRMQKERKEKFDSEIQKIKSGTSKAE